MFFPRLITFLLALGCATIAFLASSEYFFAIPLPFLKWVVIIATSFFGASALIMFIGLTDAKRTEHGELEFGTTLRGRMMSMITSRDAWGREKHCCDVYIDTSLASFFVMFMIGALALLVLFALAKTAEFFSMLLIIAVFIVLVALLVWSNHKLSAHMEGIEPLKWVNVSSATRRLLARVSLTLFCVGTTLAVGAILYVSLYMPIAELMKLGYGLLGATAIYVGILALLPIPLYCMGGKKLLLGTKLGQKICPIVRS